MNIFLIEDADRNGAVLTIAFSDSRAALRYIQRFGKPSYRVLPIGSLWSLDDVNTHIRDMESVS